MLVQSSTILQKGTHFILNELNALAGEIDHLNVCKMNSIVISPIHAHVCQVAHVTNYKPSVHGIY